MDDLEEHHPHMTTQASYQAMDRHPITEAKGALSELLEDSRNSRQRTNQELNFHLFGDTLFSEQQKLRLALDWAHSFLSSGSELHREFSRADSLVLANEKDTPAYTHSSAAKYHHPFSYASDCEEVTEGSRIIDNVWQIEPSNYQENNVDNHICISKPLFQENPCVSFILGRDEVIWPENLEATNNTEQHDTTHKQTPRLENNSKTNSFHMSHQRQHKHVRNTSQTFASSDGATGLIKKKTIALSSHEKKTLFDPESKRKATRDGIRKTETNKEGSGYQRKLRRESVEKKMGPKKKPEKVEEVARTEIRKEHVDDEEQSNSGLLMCAIDNKGHGELEQIPKQMEMSANLADLTVYEQYQLCMDRLSILRKRQSESECFIQRKTTTGITQPRPTSCFEIESSNKNAGIQKQLINGSKGKADFTKTPSSAIEKNQDRATYNKHVSTQTEHGESGPCGNLKTSLEEQSAAIDVESRRVCHWRTITSDGRSILDSNKHCDLTTSTDEDTNTHLEQLQAAPQQGLLPRSRRQHPDVKGHQVEVKGQMKRGGGASRMFFEKSSMSSLSKEWKFSRPQSAEIIRLTKRNTPEDRGSHTSVYRETPSRQDDRRPTSQAAGTSEHINVVCKYTPADVAVCDGYLCLPDEVWLCILSLLTLSDLCRVTQVCHRLHSLATDHTLWKELRIGNCTLSDQWLLCVAGRRPRSLCLYNCSGLSAPSRGLEMFFSLCRNSLEEVKVVSCCGPGLHGDLVLPLIGQLCDHVTYVDASWSGATDTGVEALSGGCAGLKLKAVVLNGCQVTDDPLMKLVKLHKGSLCRLEVFGCQFLTSSCLQTIYEMCPGLQHLNIGQVPKVNAHCLTVMTSQLKCLLSLNLTGLQAVTQVTVDTLLQSCVNLHNLTLSSCPGVTDLTLHSISKYTPCIKSLDVSRCKAVTDAGVHSLALACRRLEQLDISSTDTGNRGVTLLANYCSRHLHTVKLSFCHISSENILKLCRRCERLKVLHLYGCSQLPTDTEIREVNSTVQVYHLP